MDIFPQWSGLSNPPPQLPQLSPRPGWVRGPSFFCSLFYKLSCLIEISNAVWSLSKVFSVKLVYLYPLCKEKSPSRKPGNFGVKHYFLAACCFRHCNWLLSWWTSKSIDHFPLSFSGHGPVFFGGGVWCAASQKLVFSRTHWKMFHIQGIDPFFPLRVCVSFLKVRIMSCSFLLCWSWVQVLKCRRFSIFCQFCCCCYYVKIHKH